MPRQASLTPRQSRPHRAIRRSVCLVQARDGVACSLGALDGRRCRNGQRRAMASNDAIGIRTRRPRLAEVERLGVRQLRRRRLFERSRSTPWVCMAWSGARAASEVIQRRHRRLAGEHPATMRSGLRDRIHQARHFASVPASSSALMMLDSLELPTAPAEAPGDGHRPPLVRLRLHPLCRPA